MRLSLFAAAALALTAAAASAEPTRYHVVGKIALPDGGWDLVSFDPAMGRVYVAHGDMVSAINTADQTVIGKFAPASRSHAAVAINSGTEVLVTNGGDNTAAIFNAKTGTLTATVKTGEKPDAAMVDDASGLAVVMNAKTGDLTLINPRTHAVVAQVPVGGSLELGASLGGGKIAVNVEDKNEVVLIDLKARAVIKHIALKGCDGPTGVAWLPISKRILSSCVNGVAAITDPLTDVVTTLPIGRGPDTVLYDAKRKLAFVPAGRSGELDIFADEATGVRALGKVDTQMGARTGALDPATGRIYLVAADYEPAISGARPQQKPGSVVALVVAP